MYERYCELLVKSKVSSYKVSKDTGISQATLSDWKAGRSIPKLDKLKKLASYFGVPITYLTGDC